MRRILEEKHPPGLSWDSWELLIEETAVDLEEIVAVHFVVSGFWPLAPAPLALCLASGIWFVSKIQLRKPSCACEISNSVYHTALSFAFAFAECIKEAQLAHSGNIAALRLTFSDYYF